MCSAQWNRQIDYVSEQKAANEEHTVKDRKTLYICVAQDDKDEERPVVLGAGNYAVVILAANSADPENADHFYAIKLLRKDTESKIFSTLDK